MKEKIVPITFRDPNITNKKLNINSPIYYLPELIAPDEVFVFMDDRCVPNIIPNRYMISNYGRGWDIYRQELISQYYDGKGYYPDGTPKGYLYFSVGYYTSPYEVLFRNVRTNRMVLLAFNWISGCEDLEANHKNGIHGDNRLVNLEWMTTEENLLHSKENRLIPSGEDRQNSILTNQQAIAICEELAKGLTTKEIANKFNVSYDIVYGIRTRHSYRYVSENYTFPELENPTALTSDDKVEEVCKLLEEDKLTYDEISKKVGIKDRNVISDIKNRKRFTHISNKYTFRENGTLNSLPENVVRDICERLSKKEDIEEISRITNIPKYIIYGIIKGHSYKYIAKDYDISSYRIELSDEQVIDICERLMRREAIKDITNLYNFNSSAIVDNIKAKKTYTHITSKYDFPKQNINTLTDEDVHNICKMLQDGYKPPKISKELNIPISKVYHIKYRDYSHEITSQYTW